MILRERIKKPKFFLKGIATYLPSPIAQFLPQLQLQFRGKGIRKYEDPHEMAMNFYTSWMRTLITLDKEGQVDTSTIKSIAEIGPGDSLATGLAAMLSGVDHYLGLDAVPTAYNFNNEEIFEELVNIFKKRTPLLTREECPKQRPYLDSYNFPSHILTDERLARTLSDSRIENIRQAIRAKGKKKETDEISISYSVPWDSDTALAQHAKTIDMVMSFAALEHVDDVPRTYYGIDVLLKDDGVIASSIDYKCHDTAGLRNGQYWYTDLEWKIVRGKSAFLINRWPHGWHMKEMQKYCDILQEQVFYFPNKNILERADLAPRFSQITDEDIKTAEAFIVGRKKKNTEKS